MKIKPYKNVGVEIIDLDITNMTEKDYEEVAEVFFHELMVLIRNQKQLVVPFAKIARHFGKIINMDQCVWRSDGIRISPSKEIDPYSWQGKDEDFPVQRVTGKKVNNLDSGIFGTGILDWHCNINGASWAPGVGLQAVEGVDGTQTSWMDTVKAYRDLPEDLKLRCNKVVGHFEYSPEIWAEGLPDWQLNGMTGGKTLAYRMPLVNVGEKGQKGLYFHFLNHCSLPEDPELLEILKKHCFKEKYIQTIDWRKGDIHLSHQILTLHRREQNGREVLSNRVLNRYTFDFSKAYPDQKPLYLK